MNRQKVRFILSSIMMTLVLLLNHAPALPASAQRLGQEAAVTFSGWPGRMPLQNITTLTAGIFHTCALTGNGGVKCWGWNHLGQLGDGSFSELSPIPVNVAGLSSGVATVKAGSEHTCALTSGDSVLCWGRNFEGQLGNDSTAPYVTPVAVNGLSSGVTVLSTGGYHTCVVVVGGGVLCWGRNSEGQIGDGTNTNRLVPVAVSGLSSGVTALGTGGYHTCALLTGGDVQCWGDNFFGQLGDGTTESRLTPVPVIGLNGKVIALAAGDSHTCALIEGGTIQCWGANFFGQTGNGSSSIFITTPVEVVGLSSEVIAVVAGLEQTCALTREGGVKCWGGNSDGQVGNGTATPAVYSPTDVVGLESGVTGIAAGADHTCAVLTTGEVRCWGSAFVGQLGYNPWAARSTPVGVAGLFSNTNLVTAGGSHTCVAINTGALYCWGNNDSGQVGDGTTTDFSTPVQVSGLNSGVRIPAAGADHTCAVTQEGAVYCWGDNFTGQLGDGTSTDRLTPTQVNGLSSGISDVMVGSFHTCALTEGKAVKCWGSNFSGQLGDGTRTNRLTPTPVSGLSSGVTSLTAGAFHTCARSEGGGISCWGDNFGGQLGDGTRGSRLTPAPVNGLSSGVSRVTAGWGHTCALSQNGGVKCWGSNKAGQLGDGTRTDRLTPTPVSGLSSGVIGLSAGAFHTCALLAGGGVKCWGNNDAGQLGDGTLTQRLTPVAVVGLSSGISGLEAGGKHTCAFSGGGVLCWGDHVTGQLGIGNPEYVTVPVEVIDPFSVVQLPGLVRP